MSSTIHVSGLGRQTIATLKSQANAEGLSVEGYIKELIESEMAVSEMARRLTIDDVFSPAQKRFRESGVSDKDTDDGNSYIRRILPYRTHDHRIAGVVITFVDITARRSAERQLQQLNQTLENRVRERTESLNAMHEILNLASAAVGIGVWD